jgi:hypothetical protein
MRFNGRKSTLSKCNTQTFTETADKHAQTQTEVNNLVEHSYGGSVALQPKEDNGKYGTTIYGAPVFDHILRNPFHRPRSYCNTFDPVNAADMGAYTKKYVSPVYPYPHSYTHNHTPKMAMPKHYHNNAMMRHATQLRVPLCELRSGGLWWWGDLPESLEATSHLKQLQLQSTCFKWQVVLVNSWIKQPVIPT